MSYAEAAASGPKQTPAEAAAPAPPSVITDETASTASLIDVNTPSVRTVPSDFMEQDVQTETQAARQELEDKARRARAEAELAKKKSASKAHKADGYLTALFGNMSEGARTAVVAANAAAVLGVGALLAVKGYGLWERGRLDWKSLGVGLGALAGVGAVETVLGRYMSKTKK